MRLLGAVFPREDGAWYFKVMGPADVMEAVKPEVDAFVRSVRFTGMADPPLTWTVPEGWKKGRGNQFSYAAFSVGREGQQVELTVSPVKGSLLMNLNRWRGQIGLGDIGPGDLARETTEAEIDGVKATLVDWTGQGKAKPARMPPFAGGGRTPPFAGNAGAAPKFTLPAGWKEAPLKPFSVATLQVSEGGGRPT